MVKVSIDQETCIGCGQCYSTCLDLYQDDGTGTAEIVDEYQQDEVFEGDVAENIECAENGADVCPVDAITLD